MRKSIPLEQVVVGMRVVGLDKSWFETPFLAHRIRIESSGQIDQLRALGIRVVDIEVEREDDPAAPVDAGHHARGSDEPPPGRPPGDGRDGPSPRPLAGEEVREPGGDGPAATDEGDAPVIPFADELPVARAVYSAATDVVRQAMDDVRMGRAIREEAVGEVVRDLMGSILRNRDPLVSLSRLKSFDEYTFFHSVNTAVLALGLGQKVGLGESALIHLGTGALLHDIGKMKIPPHLLNKPGKLATEEFEIMKQHALRGVEILQAAAGFSEQSVRPALEHHERVNGSGYPFKRSREELSVFGMIASVVDIYDAVTSDRVYHKAMPSYQALQLLYGLAGQGHVDQALVEHFIRCIGVYPVGSCVTLGNGEVGIVTQVHRRLPLRPVLLIIRDAEARRLPSPRVVDLSTRDTDTERITGVLDPREHAIDTAAYLEPAAA